MDQGYDQLELLPEKEYEAILKTLEGTMLKFENSSDLYKTFFSCKESFISKTQPVREIKTSLRRGVIIYSEYQSLDIPKNFDTSEQDLFRLIKRTKLFFKSGFKWVEYFELARNSIVPGLNAHQCHPKKQIKLLNTDKRLREYTKALHFVNCYASAINIPTSNRKELLQIEAYLNEYLNV